MAQPPLMMQTTYAELLERCTAAAFGEAFSEDGTFVPKTIKGKTYWYFQTTVSNGRSQRYVGPETPELLSQIARHRDIRNDARERRTLVSALVRSYGLPRPLGEIGEAAAALARAGVFRLRAVLIGTVAYQTYSAMLGARLPAAVLSTEDVDIAQFKNVSIAVEDAIPPVLDVLKAVDKSFRAVPHQHDSRRSTSYVGTGGLRVDFLTPNEGADTGEPQTLPSLRTDAEPLRFLDFLIHEPEAAVILHGPGIYVHVPSPERYAVHKLIVARRRRVGSAKGDKDLHQSQALIGVLAQKRPHEFEAVWSEAVGRGPAWKQALEQSVAKLETMPRDTLLKTVSWKREMVEGLVLRVDRAAARYDADRDVVVFSGTDNGGKVRCEISREALDDHFGADGMSKEGRLEQFRKNRSLIERLAVAKYLSRPVDEPGVVLVKPEDVPGLRRAAGGPSAAG